MHANLIDLLECTIHEGTFTIEKGTIAELTKIGPERPGLPYVLPGFVDAHVHIESSMLTPSQFARLAVVHGTVGTVSDPHEIGNVLGIEGVKYMIEDGRRVPFKFCFGAPSCVPATAFETAGATIDAEGVAELLSMDGVGYLAEMMNYPGVLSGDAVIRAKIASAKQQGKPVDGHAPGLRGDDARTYAAAGISTDHECFTYDEAREKLDYGMHILIREGSAARNFDELIPLLGEFPDRIMFCSDDKHPDSLAEGHINLLVKRALALGHDLFDVLRAASLNPVVHYRLPVGLLREGDAADFIVVDDLKNLAVLETYLDGALVARSGQSRLPDLRSRPVNQFNCPPTSADEFRVGAAGDSVTARVIEVLDGQLVTKNTRQTIAVTDGELRSSVERDILKVTVVNRYRDAPPAVAFIRGFGLKRGALASSVAHDSHNIIAVGTDDASLCLAVNAIIEAKGGLSAVLEGESRVLPLPIAGLLTDQDGYYVAEEYTKIDRFVKDKLGCALTSPFMSLSFMALLVIPSLKISDKGLFDGDQFNFVPVYG